MSNILILAYKFPPMGTIGTRRWTKFAKYLSKNHNISVLAREYKYKDTVNWNHDVENLDIDIQYFKTSYPMLCLKNEKKFFEKVVCKIFSTYTKYFSNAIDIADYPFVNFYEKASQIITSKNITDVVVTAPPHSFLYYATILKSEFPHINLIIDYRDPWNYFPAYKLINFKSMQKKMKSINMEIQAISMADKIICTTNDMSKYLKQSYPNLNLNISTIYNAYDKDDYSNVKTPKNIKNEKILIMYAGSLESGRIEAIKLIAKSLHKMEKNNQDLNIKFIFYSNKNLNSFSNFKYFETLKKYFIFNEYLKQDEIFNQISLCDIALSINSFENPAVISTKVFDYMALKKPIWHISEGGELFQLLEDNSQYVSKYDFKDIESILESILEYKSSMSNIPEYKEFDIINQTKKLEQLL